MKLLLIAGFGAAGTLARYGVSTLLQKPDGAFPWGTLAVNAAGCFVMGVIAALAQTAKISNDARTVIAAGFLGALTTWSSFAWESLALAKDGAWGLAALNVIAHVVVGLGLAAAGYALGRST